MQKPLSTVIDSDKQRLARNSMGAIAGTALSRISGIIRTLIVNAVFGANTTLDAFNAAFRFPNSLRDLFADGALSAAFVKVLVDISNEGDKAIQELFAITTGFFLFVTLLLAIVAVIFAKPFITLIGGHEFIARGGLTLAVPLFQLLIFYLPITMLNAIVMGVLSLKGDMFRAMNGSIFLSVGMITGALIFAGLFNYLHFIPIFGLALGAMLGVLAQFFYQAYPLKKWGLLALPDFNPRHWFRYVPLKTILLLMAPRAFGQGALILALMVNTFFAIQVGAGALTYVATAIVIIQVPIGLFGVSTGFAALPLLSAAFKETHEGRFNYLLKQSLATANWLSLLTLIGFSLLIVPIYFILFQHGKITFGDTIQNSIAICAYGIGIFFAAPGKILLNALYAVNATRQIIYNSLAYLIVNVTLSAILTPYFGLVGLGISFATATAVDCWLNMIVVHLKAKQHLKNSHFNASNLINFLVLSLLAYVAGISGVMLCQHFWSHISLTMLSALGIVAIAGSLLMLIFILLCLWAGPEQLQKMWRNLFRYLANLLI